MKLPALACVGALVALTAASVEAAPSRATLASIDHAPENASQDALSGRWAMLQVMSNRADVPFVGHAYTDTRAVILFDLVHEQGRLSGEGQTCSLDVKATPDLVRPVLPDTFKKAVSKQTFSGRLLPGPNGLHLVGDRQLDVIGVSMANKERDPMPDGARDPRIVDGDRDKKPGLTMRVEGLFDIEIYLAQRQWSQANGRRTAPDRFEGELHHDAEQVLLGSDSILVQGLPSMEPVPDRSRFVLVRLDSSARCTDAQAALHAK